MHLDWAPIRFVDQTIGNGDVLGLASSKSEYRPAGAERGIRNSNVLATTEESAGIVLTFDGAVADVNVLRADEVKAVVVAIHAIVYANARKVHIGRLNDADRMIGTLEKRDIPYSDVFALMEKKVVRTIITSTTRWRWDSASGTVKLEALPIDDSRTFDDEVIGFDRKDQPDVAIV